MSAAGEEPTALHLYDCADVGATLVQYGRAMGRPWRFLPARDTSLDNASTMGSLGRTASIAKWTATRWLKSFDADLLHIHFGTRLDVLAKWPRRPFIVHYHGTDIRTFYYDPLQRGRIQWGADNAEVVLYSTPDLKVHAERARSDAIYLPNPVNLGELPAWDPNGAPVVVFSSRWDDSKGGQQQLELLSAIRRALGPEVRLEGLEWGNGAQEARRRGVELIPRMSKQHYLRWLSKAHCVVGQTSGILAMSELQSVAIGVPLVARLEPGFYPDPVPVISAPTTDGLAAEVASVMQDPVGTANVLQGRQWVNEHHSPDAVVNQLATIYGELA
ncbi:hypothetical protein GCM10009784_16430 [Arthrobacter parietis]|uniref:D-inositol 3-phosphate glycosyltransferase n=1 Tax=Arthrobacter parietis TaxID=271434 RepID=A0ABN3AUW6_9MICC